MSEVVFSTTNPSLGEETSSGTISGNSCERCLPGGNSPPKKFATIKDAVSAYEKESGVLEEFSGFERACVGFALDGNLESVTETDVSVFPQYQSFWQTRSIEENSTVKISRGHAYMITSIVGINTYEHPITLKLITADINDHQFMGEWDEIEKWTIPPGLFTIERALPLHAVVWRNFGLWSSHGVQIRTRNVVMKNEEISKQMRTTHLLKSSSHGVFLIKDGTIYSTKE